MKITNKAGKEFGMNQWDAMVQLMDDEICEDLNAKLAPCTEQEFFAAYEEAHEAKFGDEWELSKSNPEW